MAPKLTTLGVALLVVGSYGLRLPTFRARRSTSVQMNILEGLFQRCDLPENTCCHTVGSHSPDPYPGSMTSPASWGKRASCPRSPTAPRRCPCSRTYAGIATTRLRTGPDRSYSVFPGVRSASSDCSIDCPCLLNIGSATLIGITLNTRATGRPRASLSRSCLDPLQHSSCLRPLIALRSPSRSRCPQESEASGEITFYDSNTGKPLFFAPRGRSWEDFVKESKVHGWPSFRDEEVRPL